METYTCVVKDSYGHITVFQVNSPCKNALYDEHGYRIELRELQARFENYMKGE